MHERDFNLETNVILGVTDEANDFEVLLEPAKKKFDDLASAIKIRYFLSASIKIVPQYAQYLARIGLDAHFSE